MQELGLPGWGPAQVLQNVREVPNLPVLGSQLPHLHLEDRLQLLLAVAEL